MHFLITFCLFLDTVEVIYNLGSAKSQTLLLRVLSLEISVYFRVSTYKHKKVAFLDLVFFTPKQTIF